MHSCLKMRNTNCDASSATMLEVADEWPPCTALVAASGDPGAGTASHYPVEGILGIL